MFATHKRISARLALKVISAIVLVVSLIAAGLTRIAGVRYENEPSSADRTLSPVLKQARLLFWIGYGSAVSAGLMIIGHAYEIPRWMNLDANLATWATTVIAFCNMLGGFSAGYYADRLSSRQLLRWLPLFTLFGLTLLVLPLDSVPIPVFIGLALVGYCYSVYCPLLPYACVFQVRTPGDNGN